MPKTGCISAVFLLATVAYGQTIIGPTPPANPPSTDSVQNESQTYFANSPSSYLELNGLCVGSGCAPSLPVPFPGLTVFGDSVGCGGMAGGSPSGHFISPSGFAWLMETDIGGPFTNYCFEGDEAPDLVREWAMPYVPPPNPTESRNPIYVVEIGGNDAKDCGNSSGCLTTFQLAVQAAVAWLAIPDACKTYGQSTAAKQSAVYTNTSSPSYQCGPIGPPTYTGSWAADNFTFPSTSYIGSRTGGVQPTLSGVAEYTGSNGTISIPVTTMAPNQNVYCGYRVTFATSTASASISIDGSMVDTWSPQASWMSGSTGNGTTDAVFVKYYPIANPGSHTVLISASASSTYVFSFAWCGVSPRTSYEPGQPYVILPGVPRSTQTSDTTTLLYDNIARSIATAFAQDGLQVTFADVRKYLNNTPLNVQSTGPPIVCFTTPANADLYCDGVHLTAQGHQHARDALEASIVNGIYQQQAYGQLTRSCGTFTTTATTSEAYSCLSITPNSICYLSPTNSTAASLLSGLYISAKNQGSITLHHTATAGGTFDVSCTLR